MATITQRGKDQWQVKVRRKGFGVLSRTFSRYADALDWARRIEGEVQAGTSASRGAEHGLTFGEAIRRYMIEVIPRKRGASREVSKLKPYVDHPFAKRPLALTTPRDMADLRDWRLLVVSRGTVLREFCVLRNLFEVARRDWFLTVQNPVRAIRLPAANPARERRLRPGELEVLISAARTYGGLLPLAIEWLIETAMRRGEACQLLRSDVDWGAGTARVSQSKNGRPRTVPLTVRAAEIAAELLVGPDKYLFPIRPDSMTQAFERVCERAGIHDLTLHDLRHEATSRFVEIGLSMAEVMAITGHRDPRMMLRYYQPNPQKLRDRLRGTAPCRVGGPIQESASGTDAESPSGRGESAKRS